MRRATVHARCLLVAIAIAGCGGARPGETTSGASAEATPIATTGNEAIAATPSPHHSTRPEGPGHRRQPDLSERRVMREIQGLTAHLRDLEFARDVPMLVEDRIAITADVTAEIESESLERSRDVYVALGLLAPDLDVRALLARVLGEQVVGFYDPERGVFAIRDDVMTSLRAAARQQNGLDEARVVLVHELVHALQDQRLGLGRVYEADRDTDADNAFHALVEGDATLAMIAYAGGAAGVPLAQFTAHPSQLRMLVSQSSPLPGDELGRAPAIVRVPLVSAYIDGMLFCAELHAQRGWRAIDEVHHAPPTSTEQVLHPEKFFAHETPDVVSLAAFDDLEPRGLTRVSEDTLGELEMSVFFGLGGTEAEAKSAAAGWGGDRLRAYRSDGATAVIWVSHWDTEAEAREAEPIASRSVQVGAAVTGRAHVAERRGEYVLVARNLPTALVDPVRERFARLASPAAH